MLSMIPAGWRLRILSRMFREGSARLFEAASATENDHRFKHYAEQFSYELRAIIRKLAAPAASEKTNDRKTVVLKLLLDLDNELYKAISAKACECGGGMHPKHRLMRYHDFFCKNVGLNESVLDIGCGNGFLTSDVAKCTRGRVVGIDMNRESIEFAKKHYGAANIEYLCDDVNTGSIGQSHFDVVILSNVLEHLPNRAGFLEQVREKVRPTKFLIRVPMYEREWMVPLKAELGIEYMLDATHKIEYTQNQFFEELCAAGLSPESCEIGWGEIWCRAVSARPAAGEAGASEPQ